MDVLGSSKTVCMFAVLLILVGIAPAGLLMIREFTTFREPHSLPVTPVHGQYVSQPVRVDVDSEYGLWATLNRIPGALGADCSHKQSSLECENDENVLDVVEELERLNYSGTVIANEVYKERLVIGRREGIRGLPAGGRDLFPQRLRVKLKVFKGEQPYYGAYPTVEIDTARDAEGNAVEMATGLVWAVVMGFPGAILLYLSMKKKNSVKAFDSDPA